MSCAVACARGQQTAAMATEVESPQNQLEQLFLACDTDGSGYIGRQQLRDLCRGFDISGDDSDLIFADLDRDGDDRISFSDFCRGFRDCVNNDFAQVSCRSTSVDFEDAKDAKPAAERGGADRKADRREHGKKPKKRGLRRRDSMHHAFKQFSKTLGEENVLHFIGNRWVILVAVVDPERVGTFSLGARRDQCPLPSSLKRQHSGNEEEQKHIGN